MIYDKRACMTFEHDKVYVLFEGGISSEFRRFISSMKYTGKKLMKDPESGMPKIFTIIDISKDRRERLESIFAACEDEKILILCRYGFKFDYEKDNAGFVYG